MIAGEWYLADDPVLVEERARCARLLQRFNAAPADDEAARAALLAELLGALGDEAVVRPPLLLDYGYQTTIGRRTFVNFGAVILDVGTVSIGDEVQIGPGVQLVTAVHPLEPDRRRAGWEAQRPIVVGDGAWLGGGMVVCPGVSIGPDAVVGAGAVVTRDVPPGVVVAGNPARVIRELPS